MSDHKSLKRKFTKLQKELNLSLDEISYICKRAIENNFNLQINKKDLLQVIKEIKNFKENKGIGKRKRKGRGIRSSS